MDNTIDFKEVYYEWVQIADRDYSAAKKMFNEKWTQHQYLICYLSQQAAEKYLKGYIAYNGEEIVKTHVLETLLDICIKYDKEFNILIDECEFLTIFAIQTRYPDIKIDVNDVQAKRALDSVETIIDFVKDKMKDI